MRTGPQCMVGLASLLALLTNSGIQLLSARLQLVLPRLFKVFLHVLESNRAYPKRRITTFLLGENLIGYPRKDVHIYSRLGISIYPSSNQRQPRRYPYHFLLFLLLLLLLLLCVGTIRYKKCNQGVLNDLTFLIRVSCRVHGNAISQHCKK